MIEHVSLKTLVEISNHPTLSLRLVEVLISTDMFNAPSNPDPQYPADDIPREWLLRTGDARDMLAEAFSKLKNLRSVGLRDYSAAGRTRDGPAARWRSYGRRCFVHLASTLLISILSPGWSANPNVPAHMRLDGSSGSLFSLILRALGSAPAFPPNLQVILRKDSTLVPYSFRVDSINAPVISRLQSLFITLRADMTGWPATPTHERPLRSFLHTATDLKTLRLNFDSRWAIASRLLSWLGTPAAATDRSLNDVGMLEIPPAPLCNLTKLDIGMAMVSSTSLLQVLARFNLKSFGLWKIVLLCDDQTIDQWSRFLADLSRALGATDSVQDAMIGNITQFRTRRFGVSSDATNFCPEGTEDKAKISESDLMDVVTFRAQYGLAVSAWLMSISERTYVRSIHAPMPPNSEESDRSGSEEDDEEEEEEDDEEE